MRGRRGQSSSSSSSAVLQQQQNRMALRKQIITDGGNCSSESQQGDEDTQEDGDLNDRDESSSLLPSLSLRERRKRERENKSKPKEMTEEEMMDLALRLSEREANITALRLQKEEEAMMKAIQESMVSQTQPCPPFESQSLLSDPDAPLRLCSRRKLSYSNRKQASEVGTWQETDLNGGAEGAGDESPKRSKKRRKKEGSPLLEMPDLSQTQKISTQDSPVTPELLDLQLDSPQSCDSTQIKDCKSPVFPSVSCRAEVQVPPLSQNLLDSCRTSGFVLCSQNSVTAPPKSPSTQPKSPTFPKSPQTSRDLSPSKSPVFSETEQGDDSETQLSPGDFKSPVFGQTTQHEKSQKASRPQDCNTGFTFSSQDSSSSSVKSTSCRPQSPVFLQSPGRPETVCPAKGSGVWRSPEFSGTDGEQSEQRDVPSTSPVFDRTEGEQKHSEGPESRGLSQSLKQKVNEEDADEGSSRGESHEEKLDFLFSKSHKTTNADVKFNKPSKSDDSEEDLTEISKDCNPAEMELSNNMKLLWSDDDDTVTPAGSPSPIFPDETTAQSANAETAAINHVTAASAGLSGSNSRQQISTSETNSQRSEGEPASGTTVYYHWGVPFCPRGVNPDSYTQVILAQMEVYEKSLKQAQRCLLRKVEWGEAVLPQVEKSPPPESQSPESSQQDVPRRRGIRLRRNLLNEDAEREEEKEEKKTEGEETKEDKDGKMKNEGGESGRVDPDDCDVCPETQLSNKDDDDDETQDLLMETEAEAELQCGSPEEVDVDMILRDDSPVQEETQKEAEVEMEVDAQADKETKGNINAGSSRDVGGQEEIKALTEDDQGDIDVEEVNSHRLQRSTSPEIELAATAAQSPDTNVDCPICQGSFPVTEIEMHAAYCDGEVAVVHERRPKADSLKVLSKPCRKRTRRAEVREEEETEEPLNTGKNQEKCYVCQKAVPLRDYSRHTELCIQRRAPKTAGRGNLLSALEQTDGRDSEPGPSGSRLQTREVIDLRDDDDDEDGVSSLRISNSPIRAFTPISEATDCLIDFKKQRRAKKPSQRRR
ncbi:BRCA1-A complex subunit RAP80 isoform X2 [Xyrichtys novacula]|uniref:BRCA1-A complex subunit RAP80 isoform X2 n=1 Tax=Xyrichtys novacula TaxID=13765 RepID=A0AAV1FQ38_XYRNO|nr:BRCA1-A complex subunit RAP80 isoform X2 [Xyrichtys novacula]